jgi:hypothetical protein
LIEASFATYQIKMIATMDMRFTGKSLALHPIGRSWKHS